MAVVGCRGETYWIFRRPTICLVNDTERQASWAPHLRVGGLAALLPLGLGLTLLASWVWLGTSGLVLAFIADLCWLLWWRAKHGALFPLDIAAGTLVKLAVFTAIMGGIAWLAGR